MGVRVEGLTASYGRKKVLENISLQFDKGKFIALIGPNGSGKSSLLKTLLHFHKPDQGLVEIDGRLLTELKAKERAGLLAFLPQAPEIHESISVRELVLLGRYHHKRFMRNFSSEDYAAVSEAISWVDLTDQSEESVLSLSGGQRQRAFLAMILAQQTDYIFLDEPTAYLDVNYQIDFIELLKRLQTELGKTIVIVLHDLPAVAKYADQVIALHGGGIYASGNPSEVFTSQMLEEVFSVRASIRPIADSAQVLCYDFRKLDA